MPVKPTAIISLLAAAAVIITGCITSGLHLSTSGRVCHWKLITICCWLYDVEQIVPMQPGIALVFCVRPRYAKETFVFGPNCRLIPPPAKSESYELCDAAGAIKLFRAYPKLACTCHARPKLRVMFV